VFDLKEHFTKELSLRRRWCWWACEGEMRSSTCEVQSHAACSTWTSTSPRSSSKRRKWWPCRF